jgi:hypothetical protein
MSSLFPYNQLLASACEFLRYEQGCYLLAWERSPWEHRWHHKPDVMGVERGRRVLEIEIKRSVADFKADAKKRIWGYRSLGYAVPFKFWYLVPPELVEEILPMVPAGLGLLTVGPKTSRGGNAEIICASPAKTNRKASVLRLKDMVHMARDQSGTLVSAVSRLAQCSVASAEEVA